MCVHARTKKSPHTNKSCHTHTSHTHNLHAHQVHTRKSRASTYLPRVCMSHVNESGHTHTSYTNKSCNTHTSHGQQPTPPEYACHIWMSHVTHTQGTSHTPATTRFSRVSMSHMNRCMHHVTHTHTRHVTHTHKSRATTCSSRVSMPHINESCHTHTQVQDTSHTHTSHAQQPISPEYLCHIWMRHVTHKRVTSHINESCHTSTSHVTHQWVTDNNLPLPNIHDMGWLR